MKINKYIIAAIVVLNLFFSFNISGQSVIEKDGMLYLSNRVIVKIADTDSPTRLKKQSDAKDVFASIQKLGSDKIEKRFHLERTPLTLEERSLDKIYTVTFDSPRDPEIFARKISKVPGVEWAEPHYVRKVFYEPNDTMYTKSQQAHLTVIQAEQAWDISKGDPSIIIAVIDTGVDWEHSDLADNIWINSVELNGADGVDDDNNGFVDDVRGWDFGGTVGTPDNNPAPDNDNHGTHVAGIASAVTDNDNGIASIGFNCSILPVKTSQQNLGADVIAYGVEGIYYAADMGAQIINLSFGGPGFSFAEKAAVDYAISKGSVVIAAAGNSGSDVPEFPASYEGVFSIGNTNNSDTKSYSSNYGATVDVMAPGSSILSTYRNNSYGTIGGTSMSSPLVAGLAGLVKEHFPNYNMEQVVQQIRVTADNIDATNPTYVDQMGGGRINAYNALSNSNAVSVRATSVTFIDNGNGNGRFESGETASIEIEFTNYLSAINGVTVTLESKTEYATVGNASFNTGAVGTLNKVDNQNNKFTFEIGLGTPADTELNFILRFSGNGYTDFQWISVNANQTFETFIPNNLALTMTSRGIFGFNDSPQNTQGEGLRYSGNENLLFEGFFMYGTSSEFVIDGSNDEFNSLQPYHTISNSTTADFEGLAIFNDDNAGVNKLGIETRMHCYGYSDLDNDDYMVLRFAMRNNSESDITGLYAGICFDLDFYEGNYTGDIVKYSSSGDFGYAYDLDGDPTSDMIAASLLSDGNKGFYAASDSEVDGIFPYQSFNDEEMWTTLTSGTSHSSFIQAGDVAFIVSGGPYDIPAGDYINVVFVLAGANNITDLTETIANARIKYNDIPTGVENEEDELPTELTLEQNYPNPFNPATTISYTVPQNNGGANVRLVVYDILGNAIKTLVDENKSSGTYQIQFDGSSLSSGVYFYQLRTGAQILTKKMLLVK